MCAYLLMLEYVGRDNMGDYKMKWLNDFDVG